MMKSLVGPLAAVAIGAASVAAPITAAAVFAPSASADVTRCAEHRAERHAHPIVRHGDGDDARRDHGRHHDGQGRAHRDPALGQAAGRIERHERHRAQGKAECDAEEHVIGHAGFSRHERHELERDARHGEHKGKGWFKHETHVAERHM